MFQYSDNILLNFAFNSYGSFFFYNKKHYKIKDEIYECNLTDSSIKNETRYYIENGKIKGIKHDFQYDTNIYLFKGTNNLQIEEIEANSLFINKSIFNIVFNKNTREELSGSSNNFNYKIQSYKKNKYDYYKEYFPYDYDTLVIESNHYKNTYEILNGYKVKITHEVKGHKEDTIICIYQYDNQFKRLINYTFNDILYELKYEEKDEYRTNVKIYNSNKLLEEYLIYIE